MALEEQKGSPRARLDSAKPGEAGQVLLIVVLVIIIASTVGLSLASRSITSLRSSTEEAESQKALAAAEAGIERAIQGSVPINIPLTNLSNNSNYVTQFTQVDSSSFLINGGNVIPKDEGTDVWFAQHDANGNPDVSTALTPSFIYLYWGSSSEACGTSTAPAAIQVIIVTSDGTAVTYRFAYDPCKDVRENNFASPDTGSFLIGGKTFMYATPQGGQNDLAKGGSIKKIVFIRVIPIYKDTVVGISICNRGGNNCPTPLPSQGYIITSTGTSGQANRKLTVFKGYPQTYLPYLSYGLFFVAN